ncbi:Tn7-like element transposition protein TnsE [Alkalihalophilus lindianensis]|uniref:Tn7-like element transposition protein TnsE n=1 Tax=Alkalihalophilus lindianensis TaxID=1630542 RepID=A0ABU3X831_9BACI|nr:Tn7-like element transposition protein TnsE [Alkalihalophilus lindianensis]MDV2684056.1 Tn7-like element transposition protein TnsE [Alkalihalophilus lindianensis]
MPVGLGERKFTKLNDGVTKRRYLIAEVYMVMGKRFNIIEVERENRSLSILVLSSPTMNDWDYILNRLLVNFVNDSGTWTSQSLDSIQRQGITIMKVKHSFKGVKHRAEMLLRKLL